MTCSLIINHLKVEGVYCFEQKFVTGVNFISGENSLGKTNLIKTIIYGLGGNDPNFAPEIKDNTTYVFLEISINDSIFTIQREIKRPGAKIKFFDKPLADIKSHDPDYKFLDPDESFSKLILNKLNLEEKLYYRSSKPNPGDKPIRLSFKELFRYFYIRQSDGYSAILNKQPERPRTKCFEYLLDLKTQDSLELENIVKELGNRKEAINRDLNYLNQLLLELGINDDNLIINRNEQINQKLKEFINKREAFRMRIEKDQ